MAFPNWATLLQSGGFSNNPSGITAAFWQTGNFGQVNFEQPVAAVGMYYASFVPITVEALDASGAVVGTAAGPANAVSAIDTWDLLSVNVGANEIVGVRVVAPAGYALIDDFSYCIAATSSEPPMTEVEIDVHNTINLCKCRWVQWVERKIDRLEEWAHELEHRLEDETRRRKARKLKRKIRHINRLIRKLQRIVKRWGPKLKTDVFSTADFDATTIDVATLTLGEAGAGATAPYKSRVKDVNKDGLPDLRLKFRLCTMVKDGAISADTTALELNGATLDGGAIHGVDQVEVRGRGL